MKNTSMGINLSKGRFASVLSMVFASGSKKQAGNDRYASKENGYKNAVLNQEVKYRFNVNRVN